MGWFKRHDMMLGKLALTGYFVNQYRRSDGRSRDKVTLAQNTGVIWGTGLAYRLGGGLLRAGSAFVVANPVTQVVTYAYVAGAITSNIIDPEEGLDNYLGFTTGGGYGNQPNYFTGDPNDSGYFNVVRNFSNILKAKRTAKNSKEQKAAEAEYIKNYWVNNHLETLTQQWLAMTPEERAAMSDFTTQ